jgi:Core-2/I-Branching enzyme
MIFERAQSSCSKQFRFLRVLIEITNHQAFIAPAWTISALLIELTHDSHYNQSRILVRGLMIKLAFLFLTINTVYHEDLWIDFFSQHEGQYSLSVHSKEPLSPTSFFKPFELKNPVPTTWLNTMLAQLELLKEALKDPANEKFIFVSESTIPLQSFDYVYAYLTSNPCSHFYYCKNYQTNRSFPPYPSANLYKNSQWVILSRAHAELMVIDTELIGYFLTAPHDQEHYPSSLLAHHGLLDEVIKKDTTLAVWDEEGWSPHTFTDLTTDRYFTRLLTAVTEEKGLFARKFAPQCDLRPLLAFLPWTLQKEATLSSDLLK